MRPVPTVGFPGASLAVAAEHAEAEGGHDALPAPALGYLTEPMLERRVA
jgi:hypothetical protein